MNRFTPVLGRDVSLRDGVESDQQAWEEAFEHGYHVPPGPRTVLDLGANIGLVSAHYKALWPDAKIVAVEMNPATARQGMVNADVEWRVHAVVGQDGPVRFDPAARAIACRVGEGDTVAEGWSLEHTIRDAFNGPVDLVKMDIEGAEWGVLKRVEAWWFLVRSLLVELHGGSRDEAVCLLSRRYDCRETIHPAAVWAVR